MRLLEAIVEANQRRVAGDGESSVSAEARGALPIAALTCIDARLNRLLPNMLGIAEDQFVWLRNAGNIITGPLSSTTRSLALACAVKGAKEIAIIGHSDCLVGKTTVMQLLDRLSALGVDRHRLPENIVEYFGLFGTERQNVIRSVDIVRSSPLIGNKVPVHGLLIDVATGKLEWVVNGYNAPVATPPAPEATDIFAKAQQTLDSFARIGQGAAEELKLPQDKIGEIVSIAEDWLRKSERIAATVAGNPAPAKPSPTLPAAAPAPPPKPPMDPMATLQQRMRQFSKTNSSSKAEKKR